MACLISQLAAKLAFFPPSPATYQVKTRDDGRVVAVSATSAATISGAADDPSLDVLLLDTKRGNKIVVFFLKNPYAKLTVLYSHGNAADLGQIYDLDQGFKAVSATVFYSAEAAFRCLSCDAKIHATNKLASRHARVWGDAAALCVAWDRDIYSVNPVARRHNQLPVVPFYDSIVVATKSYGFDFASLGYESTSVTSPITRTRKKQRRKQRRRRRCSLLQSPTTNRTL
ncbi:alpha/beta hydrolase domain-containing protein 17B-like [Ipomoea triloba]|uniref:alpha/beta hydrolase domain-containing protein 17B-like n=1 Tax=Ipomoea triloba TaxID=35885 RepID=UPI00125DDFE4|nr:alpha/beta hydrolase domain-containing protein 17B-like [Ipomoea triloba]